MRYTTIQNWSTNVYNLVTQRAKVFANGTMEWVDANLGSKVTMKYPSCYLMEPGAHGEMLSMAFAGEGCDSMKGAHKGMSAEEFKEFKKNHAWKNSPHNQIEGSSASTIEPPKTIEVKKSTPEIVEI